MLLNKREQQPMLSTKDGARPMLLYKREQRPMLSTKDGTPSSTRGGSKRDTEGTSHSTNAPFHGASHSSKRDTCDTDTNTEVVVTETAGMQQSPMHLPSDQQEGGATVPMLPTRRSQLAAMLLTKRE
jgi:hypothetical protein